MGDVYRPAGWPEAVAPPGSEDWESTAVGFPVKFIGGFPSRSSQGDYSCHRLISWLRVTRSAGEEREDRGRQFCSGERGPVVAWHLGEARVGQHRGERPDGGMAMIVIAGHDERGGLDLEQYPRVAAEVGDPVCVFRVR